MAIYLVTGQPGHGKTAYAMDKAFQFQKEGRAVYAKGVKDLDYAKAGFTYLENPAEWEDLPDGSVVLLDECYTDFPNRNPGAKVPAHVEAMARHRHRGFDFILIAQQGLQLDPFLRGLYEEHVHVRQTSIIRSKTKLKRWNQYQSNVQTACSDTVDWVRPKYVFDYYTSTTMVTTKRQLPMWIRWVAIGVVALVVLLLVVKWYFTAKIAGVEGGRPPATQTITRAAATAGSVATVGADAARVYETPTDYAKAHLPRFGTMPWTAPVFDQRTTTADPQLFCMSSQAGRDGTGKHTEGGCTCMTEQGTAYDLSQPECRTIARYGGVYNPYKQRQEMLQGAPMPLPTHAQSIDVPVQPAPSQSALISVGERPIGTFPESVQNRYTGS
jgi:zona occludens toxin (predicted ATPase)